MSSNVKNNVSKCKQEAILFIFSYFCDVAELVIIHIYSLAKFGYKQYMNFFFKKFNIPSHFWLLILTPNKEICQKKNEIK